MPERTARPQPPQAGWSLDQWLRWQETLYPKAIELGLERVREVASRLGLPGTACRTLTIAGTNGKGSSATLAAGIYRAAGYRVGLYTSPHLLRYPERVALDGRAVEDAALCDAFLAIEQARRDTPLTYFEFGTLAALWLFREARVQVQVLEVGLGGRLDAVNLVDADCALVTNIGLDHTDWLGSDRESIGREKAGILRPGRPAIVAERHPPDSIARHAAAIGAPLAQLGRDFDFSPADDAAWHWHGFDRRLEQLPLPGLAGSIQLQNACGVVAALLAAADRLPVEERAIREALPRLSLRGRFERRGNVILDVAHNAEAALVLAENLRALPRRGRVLLVLGMLADKPVEAFVGELAPVVDHAFLGGLPGPRGLAAPDLMQRLRATGLDAEICPDVEVAFARAADAARPEDLIVVTGSFLTVAAVAERLDG